MSQGFNISQIRANIERTKRELPIVLSKQAENHFTESFSLGKLDGNKWSEVNRRIPGTNEYKYKRRGISIQRQHSNPILVGTGTLRRKVSRSIRIATWNRIQLVVDLPYADRHNEGDDMPYRPFMKQTPELTVMQTKEINQMMAQIWV